MGEPVEISVNFARPMPLFPLDRVTLMPHAVLPVHIHEPRYRAMARDALDGPGQIALAVYADGDSKTSALRPAVCVGQIVEHHKLPDGRYYLVLQGVCRARIVRELALDESLPPSAKGAPLPYRRAVLEPVGIDTADALLADQRAELAVLLTGTRLRELRVADEVVKHLGDEDIPTAAILEMVTFSFPRNDELRYRLLEETSAVRRFDLLRGELADLRRLLDRAAPQRVKDDSYPKGASRN